MTKPTGKKIKGNKDDAKHFIDFFDSEFFGLVDDEDKKTTNKTISLTVPIDDGTTQKNKSNLAEHKVPQIEDFTDIEAVMKSILQLRNSVLVHKTDGTYTDGVKKEIQHIKLICNSGSSDTIFRNLTAEARTIVFDKFLVPLMVLPGDNHEKDILISDHSSFCKRIDAVKMSNAYLDRFYPDDRENSPDRKQQSEKMKEFIYRNYFQEFWSGMHQEMFGANRYRAFQLELEYLKHHIVKPYEVSVRKAMQRIDVLLTYLPFYPPRTVRSKRPSEAEWAAFDLQKYVDKKTKRDIQYNMLPSFYRDTIDVWETDYEDMDGSTFLLNLEKLEVKDMKDRQERNENKEKLKRKSEAASNGKEHPNSNRKVKTDRDNKRNRRDDRKTTQNGKARFCNMCKMSGAPAFVYETHNTKDCKKKEQYEKLLSGGAGKKKEANKEYKSFEKKMMKNVRSEFKKHQAKSKKRGDNNDSDDDMSVDSNGTNTSY
jgi:hypothetical protein